MKTMYTSFESLSQCCIVFISLFQYTSVQDTRNSFQHAQISSRYRGDPTHISELKNLEDNCHANTKFLGMIPAVDLITMPPNLKGKEGL